MALVTSYKGATGGRSGPDQPDADAGERRNFQIFRKLVVPASLTDIFAGLKLTVGFALIGAIVGEFMSSSEGLGHAIFKAGSLYIIPKVFAALVATIALALLLTFLVGEIERLLMPWRRKIMLIPSIQAGENEYVEASSARPEISNTRSPATTSSWRASSPARHSLSNARSTPTTDDPSSRSATDRKRTLPCPSSTGRRDQSKWGRKSRRHAQGREF